MNAEDLQSLASEILNGRTESETIDWKQKWYDLKQQRAQEEFRKDVAAIANSCGDGPGYIVIGLKQGSFYDAPLPYDEAALQQISGKISPTPNVSFKEFTILEGAEEKKVSVIAILPPYNRPYVAKNGALNLVPVRRGSSSGTATRFELDAFYQPKTRRPELVASWEYWPSRGLAKGKGTISETLPLPKPPKRLDEIRKKFDDNIERYETAQRQAGLPTLEEIEAYKEQAKKFLRAIELRPNLAYWQYKHLNVFSRTTSFSVVIKNNGTQVANRLKARILFPDWLYVIDGEVERPKTYVPEPPLLRPNAETQAADKRASLDEKLDRLSRFGQPPPAAPMINHLLSLPSRAMLEREKPQNGSWTDEEGETANFWAKKLSHKSQYRIESSLRLMALPSAPDVSGALTVTAELFCEEFSDWITQKLFLELI